MGFLSHIDLDPRSSGLKFHRIRVDLEEMEGLFEDLDYPTSYSIYLGVAHLDYTTWGEMLLPNELRFKVS